jgi:hypothetical protein
MAASTVTVTILSDNQSFTFGNMFGAILTGTIGANPLTYTTGGIVCNLAAAGLVKAQRPPQFVIVNSLNGNQYAYVNGTTSQNGTLKMFTDFNVEVTNNATIPAANSGDTLTFFAFWLGQN